MNTASKRMAAIGVGLPVPRLLPIPDSTISATDRQWLCWCYVGIAAGLPVTASAAAFIRGAMWGTF